LFRLNNSEWLRHSGPGWWLAQRRIAASGRARLSYNLLQPKIAGELKQRKVANIRSVQADVAASGNIGCMTQLSDAIGIPFVHTVELLDWATGGPEPDALRTVKAQHVRRDAA
jgi:hypothetical protein